MAVQALALRRICAEKVPDVSLVSCKRLLFGAILHPPNSPRLVIHAELALIRRQPVLHGLYAVARFSLGRHSRASRLKPLAVRFLGLKRDRLALRLGGLADL